MTRRDSSIFLEYQRMREEKEIKDIHDNVPIVRSMFDIPGITNVIPSPKAEMTSVDGVIVDVAPVKANEHRSHWHGARRCMISAMSHMKHLANRNPKTSQELRKNPLTTHEESSELQNVHDPDNDDGTNRDIFARVRKCRYLRGSNNDDLELSIEEIFH